MTRQPSTAEALVAEALGAFLLTFIGGAAGYAAAAAKAPGGVGLLVAALSHGLALFIIVNIIGRISGAHVNPAVTIGLASVGKFSWAKVPGYIIAQFIGGIVAGLIVVALYGNKASIAPEFGAGASSWQAFLAEAIGAGILVIGVVAAAADGRQAFPNGWAGFVIGMALTSGIFISAAVSGAGLNPALSIGPYISNLFFGLKAPGWPELLVYIIGPIIGAIVFAYLYSYIAAMTRTAATVSQTARARR